MTIVFLYQRYHPKDGQIAGKTCWRRYYSKNTS